MGGIGYITASHADISRNNILINAHMLEASRSQRSLPVSVLLLCLRLRAVQTARSRKLLRCAKKMLIPPIPRQVMDGRSSSPKSCADITGKTIASKLASCDSITSTGRSEPTRGAKKKRPPQSRAKWPWPRDGGEH